MKKKRTMPMSVMITVLVLLFAAFVLRDNFREPERIVLPPEQGSQETENPQETEESVHRVSIRPDTVQTAVATLSRAKTYSRIITVERFWEGGSGTTVTAVNAADGWLRTDTAIPGGSFRRVISGEGQSYVWYDNEHSHYVAADLIGEDAEQGILTYEDVLELPVERIAAADYRALGEFNCIYIETSPDEAGYVERYWVDVAGGLLTAAEKDCGGQLVYRMTSSMLQFVLGMENPFVLPDGTVLYEPAGGT